MGWPHTLCPIRRSARSSHRCEKTTCPIDSAEKSGNHSAGDTFTFNGRGIAWKAKKDCDKAIHDFDEAIRLDPSNQHAFNARGVLWAIKKEYEKSIADYGEAIRLDPNYVYAFNNRGNAWRLKKECDRAIADCDEAIRLDPKYANAFINRAWAWLEKKECEKALRDFDEAIRLDPKKARAVNGRGCLRFRKKEYDKAMADYDVAVQLDPKVAVYYSNRGETWAKLKKRDKAKVDFDEAMRINADAWVQHACAWFLSVLADEKHRDGKRAVELTRQAIELLGKDVEWKYYSVLAAALAESGDFDQALAEQTKALDAKSLDKDERVKQEKRLELYRQKKPYRDED